MNILKNLILLCSLISAVNIRPVSPETIAVGIAVAPYVAGAVHSTHLYFTKDEYAKYTPSQAISEYQGWFWLGATPVFNFFVYHLTHNASQRWSKNTIEATGIKAGIATDLSVPVALLSYFCFLRK